MQDVQLEQAATSDCLLVWCRFPDKTCGYWRLWMQAPSNSLSWRLLGLLQAHLLKGAASRSPQDFGGQKPKAGAKALLRHKVGLRPTLYITDSPSTGRPFRDRISSLRDSKPERRLPR